MSLFENLPMAINFSSLHFDVIIMPKYFMANHCPKLLPILGYIAPIYCRDYPTLNPLKLAIELVYRLGL